MEPCGGESPPSHHGKKVAELKTRLRSYREVTLKGDAHQVQGKGPQRGLKRPHEDEKEGTPPRKRRRKDAAPRQEGTYPKKTQWELGVVWDGSEKCDAKFNNQRASKGEVVVEGPSFKRTRMEKEPDREAAATQLVTAFAPSRKRPAQGMAERAAAGNQAPGRALPSLIPRGLTHAEHLKECRSINLRIKLLERALPRKIRYLVKNIKENPEAAERQMEAGFAYLRNLHQDMEPQRKKWAQGLKEEHPNKEINVPLIQTLLEEMVSKDSALAVELEKGMKISGRVPNSGALMAKESPATLEWDKFEKNIEKRNKRICKWLISHEEATGTAKKVWEATQNEIAKGWIGPLSEVDSTTLKERPLNPRFAIEKEREDDFVKIRIIDNLRMSKVNSVTSTEETYRPQGLDYLMCLTSSYGLGPLAVPELQFLSIDFKDAFKHIALCESETFVSAVALVEPETKKIFWGQAKTLPFGAKASPAGWGRLACFVAEVICEYLGIPVGCYVDDVYAVLPKSMARRAMLLIKETITMIGMRTDAQKEQGPAPALEVLGARVHTEDGKLVVEATEKRRLKLIKDLDEVLKNNRMTPAQAASIRGRLGYYVTLCFGKVGRGAAAPISRRQYGKNHALHLTNDIRECIEWWKEMVPALPRRSVRITPGATSVLYTDACGEGHLGAFAICGGEAVYCECHCPSWAQKPNNIFEMELLAAILGLLMAKKAFTSDAILMNVDNQGSLESLIKGNSAHETGRWLSRKFWELAADKVGGEPPFIWLEFVDSMANIADFASRMCSALVGISHHNGGMGLGGSVNDPFRVWCVKNQVPSPRRMEVPEAFGKAVGAPSTCPCTVGGGPG